MKFSTLIYFSIMMLTACSDRTLNETDSVLTEVHLQSGFFGQVIILVNDEKVYDAVMSSQQPLSGPQGQFTLSMTRGIATVKVSWGSSGAQLTDDSSVQIGSSDEYYLGITIVENALSLKIQTFEFLYL